MANLIRELGLPNYRGIRIPIKLGLKVRAWEKHLSDYSDKRVIKYIKFGFPLSLINPHELHNTEITNHFSAHSVSNASTRLHQQRNKPRHAFGPNK